MNGCVLRRVRNSSSSSHVGQVKAQAKPGLFIFRVVKMKNADILMGLETDLSSECFINIKASFYQKTGM